MNDALRSSSQPTCRDDAMWQCSKPLKMSISVSRNSSLANNFVSYLRQRESCYSFCLLKAVMIWVRLRNFERSIIQFNNYVLYICFHNLQRQKSASNLYLEPAFVDVAESGFLTRHSTILRKILSLSRKTPSFAMPA